MEKLVIDAGNHPLFREMARFLGDKAEEEVQARSGSHVHVDVQKLVIDLDGRFMIFFESWASPSLTLWR